MSLLTDYLAAMFPIDRVPYRVGETNINIISNNLIVSNRSRPLQSRRYKQKEMAKDTNKCFQSIASPTE